MKNILFVAVYCLSVLVSNIDGIIFPIDQIRIALALPSTPAINTPSVAWYILLLALAIEALAFYNGLPRNPPPKPIRRRDAFGYDGQLPLSDYGYVLDMMAARDGDYCMARYICHIATSKADNMKFMHKIMLNLVEASANQWNLTENSPRKSLIDAAYFGRNSQCFNCCQSIYPTCDLSTDQLIQF